MANAVGLDNPLTTGALKALAEQRVAKECHCSLAYFDLNQALLDAAGWGGQIDPRRLGGFLARHQQKISRGVKLVGHDDKKLKQKQWMLTKVTPH